MKIAIVGIGLIGGSMALDLKKRGFATTVTGVDNNPQHANIALLSGLVDEIDTLDNAIDKSDLIILSTPIDSIKLLLPRVLDKISGTGKVVTDTGSTKAGLAKRVAAHPARKQYVAGHPMAGTEFSGPMAAMSRLFDYKSAIVCDKEKSDPNALKTVEMMYEKLQMKIIYMNSQEHDVSAAYVSHISHISSFALSLAVLEKEKNENKILSLASGGFASTVRLAKSSADMWVPVFEQNATNVLEVLDTYMEKLGQFREAIRNGNHEYITSLIEEANKIRKIL